MDLIQQDISLKPPTAGGTDEKSSSGIRVPPLEEPQTSGQNFTSIHSAFVKRFQSGPNSALT